MEAASASESESLYATILAAGSVDRIDASPTGFDPVQWRRWYDRYAKDKNFAALKAMRCVIAAGTRDTILNRQLADFVGASTVYTTKSLDTLKTTPVPGQEAPLTPITVHNMDCLDLEHELRTQQGLNPCVLNMASATSPGGGWMKGAGAQEESLFYRSAYSCTLTKRFYPIRDKVCVIYSPNVPVFREAESRNYAFMEGTNPPRLVSFVASAAERDPERTLDGQTLVPAAAELLKAKIRLVLEVALGRGHDSIVLSAWGCGAYNHPPRAVARFFHEVLVGEKLAARFRTVAFAIFDDHNAKGAEGNYVPFANVFAPEDSKS